MPNAQGKPPTESSLQDNWQSAVEEIRQKHGLVGIGGAIYYKGEVVAITASGERQIGKGEPPTQDDLWHIGSVTKSVTATMIARLVESGILAWDMSPADVLTDEDIDEGWKAVTLEHLLTHTSGVKPNFPMTEQFNWPETENELVNERLKSVGDILKSPPKSKAGEKFVYSNVGYTIAGVMAERVTGKSWETLIREQVAEPLALDSLGFGAPQPTEDTPQPWGHKKSFFRKTAIDPTGFADNSPIMGPAGTIHMSLMDMLKYGEVHNKGHKGETSFLSKDTFEHLHTARLSEYGYGWVVPATSKWANGKLIWHNGSNTMWYALLMVAPEHDAVFAITVNDGGFRAAENDIISLPSKFAGRLTD